MFVSILLRGPPKGPQIHESRHFFREFTIHTQKIADSRFTSIKKDQSRIGFIGDMAPVNTSGRTLEGSATSKELANI